MTRHSLLALLGAVAALAGCGGAAPPSVARVPAAEGNARLKSWYLASLDTLALRLDSLGAALVAPTRPSADAQAAFRAARGAYKRGEALLQLYASTVARHVNMPVLDRMADDDPNHVVQPPEGLQVIEEGLFPAVDPARRGELANLAAIARRHVDRARLYAAGLEFTDANALEAIRLQLARVAALGLAGFDSPVALDALPESAASLAACREIVALLPPLAQRDTLDRALARAEAALRAGGSFDGFDRLAFYRSEYAAAAAALRAYRDAAGLALPERPMLWRTASTSLFERDAFDPHGLRRPGEPAPTVDLVALGARLFGDPALSGDGTRSCASCHQPARAFTDGLPGSAPLPRAAATRLRNAPTIINAGLQAASFYDLRTMFLGDQVADVVGNAAEMHGNLDTAARRVAADPAYTATLRSLGGTPDGALLRRALAAYVGSVQALDSRVDRWLRGEDVALSAEERLGGNLFLGKAKCGTCHFAPLFNGTVPPVYRDAESEVIGVPDAPRTAGARIDPDSGRIAVTGLPIHRFAFKTPTVRNAELTAPYMHNGVYRTLEEVVDFYNRGGGAGIGIALPNQTLPPDPLGLTRAEQRALVAFMRALTDTSGTQPARPARALARR